jgi:predicted transcriptional regulator
VSEEAGAPSFVVLVDGDRVAGLLARDWVLGHAAAVRAARQLGDVALQDFVTVSKDATIVDLLALVVGSHASVAVVVSSPDLGGMEALTVLGVITNAGLTETLAEGMQLFGD